MGDKPRRDKDKLVRHKQAKKDAETQKKKDAQAAKQVLPTKK
jgi:hypothetical protein